MNDCESKLGALHRTVRNRRRAMPQVRRRGGDESRVAKDVVASPATRGISRTVTDHRPSECRA